MSSQFELPQGYVPVAERGVDTRAAFITRTYNHLMGAIVAFTLFEVWIFTSGLAEPIARAMLGGSWLLVLGGFMLVSWLASRAAHSATSKGAEYGALAAMVVAQGIIFVPLLYIAEMTAPGAIQSAAITTLLGFAGLTAVAFTTRKDFSFLGGMLRWIGVMALVAIVAAVIFGFHLGTWFAAGMVLLFIVGFGAADRD